jgi:hypothetical protein
MAGQNKVFPELARDIEVCPAMSARRKAAPPPNAVNVPQGGERVAQLRRSFRLGRQGHPGFEQHATKLDLRKLHQLGYGIHSHRFLHLLTAPIVAF